MCGDDQLAEGKAEVHAFTFVAKNASKILLRSEIRIPASSTWTMTSSFEDGADKERSVRTPRRIDRVNGISDSHP